MRRRFASLMPPALLAPLLMLLWPCPARAHRLVVECRVLPEHKILVEAWYNSPLEPHPAQMAKVQVLRSSGNVLIESELDEKGSFTFTYDQPETLRVIVTQTGHREEASIDLSKVVPVSKATDEGKNVTPQISSASNRESAKEVLIGVGFLLALAAFVLGVRNARALRKLRKDDEK